MGTPSWTWKSWYIEGFLIDPDSLSNSEQKTMSGTQRQDEPFPLWRQMYDDVIMTPWPYWEKSKSFKYSHIIYRWKGNFKPIKSLFGTYVRKWSGKTLWALECMRKWMTSLNLTYLTSNNCIHTLRDHAQNTTIPAISLVVNNVIPLLIGPFA